MTSRPRALTGLAASVAALVAGAVAASAAAGAGPALREFASEYLQDRWPSAATPDEPGYVAVRSIGLLLPTPGPGRRALLECRSAPVDNWVSVDDCAGGRVTGRAGFLRAASLRGARTIALYACSRPVAGGLVDRFASDDRDCEGFTDRRLLGFLDAPAPPGRPIAPLPPPPPPSPQPVPPIPTTTGSIQPVPPPTFRFGPTRVGLRARWVESRLRGSITLTGSSQASASLRVTLRRRTAAGPPGLATSITRTVVIPPGTFGRRIALPQGLAPGRYAVALEAVSGAAVATETPAPIVLPTPRTGIVSSAFVATESGGPPAYVIGATPQLVAMFRLALPPRGPIESVWLDPDGREATRPVARAARATIVDFVARPAGLGKGRWTCLLRSGDLVVARASAVIR